MPARQDTNQNMLKQITEATGGLQDFRKKHKIETNESEDGFKKEYKSTRDVLAYMSPLRYRQQWQIVKNFTPEEHETLESCLFEYKTNLKYYTSIFLTGCLGFNYWQRQYVPRKFYFFSFCISCSMGALFSSVKTAWYFVEQMDRLGQEYELSRMIKQDIFDTRPDMNTAMRAQYY